MRKEISDFTDENSGFRVIFEGLTSIRAIIKVCRSGVSNRRIETILYSEKVTKSKSKEINWLTRISEEMGFSVEETDAATIDKAATGTSHGGIIAICGDREIHNLADRANEIRSACDISSAEKTNTDGFYVMLEGIEDPYNFGYAIRTIYAAGATGIILSPRNWMTASGVVCRSSAGASELISMYTSDFETAAEIFRSRGYKIVCAGIRDSVPVCDADLKKPLFMIVGGEKRGISRNVLEQADLVVRLDYGREFKGSLSAASAASILAYEVFRQNGE